MPDLDLLRTFLAIYRTGSTQWASQALGLPRSLVDARLENLETALGRKLFVPLPGGELRQTPAAHALASNVGQQLDYLEVVFEASRLDAGKLEGTLVIGGPAEFMTLNALPALAPLSEKGVFLRIQLGQADTLQEKLSEGRLDAVISPLEPRRRALLFEPLFEEDFVLVAGPAWASRIAVEDVQKSGSQAMATVPLVAYAEDLPLLREYFLTVFDHRIKRPATVVVPDLRAVLEATLAGAGVTVLPRHLCAPYLATGRLCDLYPEAKSPRNILYYVWKKGTPALPRVEAAAGLLKDAAIGWKVA